jgi:hypothetical protein
VYPQVKKLRRFVLAYSQTLDLYDEMIADLRTDWPQLEITKFTKSQIERDKGAEMCDMDQYHFDTEDEYNLVLIDDMVPFLDSAACKCVMLFCVHNMFLVF